MNEYGLYGTGLGDVNGFFSDPWGTVKGWLGWGEPQVELVDTSQEAAMTGEEWERKYSYGVPITPYVPGAPVQVEPEIEVPDWAPENQTNWTYQGGTPTNPVPTQQYPYPVGPGLTQPAAAQSSDIGKLLFFALAGFLLLKAVK